MVDYSKSKINYDVIEKLPTRLKHNNAISKYYTYLADELYADGYDGDKFVNKADNMSSCCSLWDIDFYREQRVKTVERLNLCRDKFCVNCQNALANKRYGLFAPVFKALSKNSKIYHVVFTVENPTGTMLRPTIDRMYKSFSYLIRYLDGRTNLDGITFKYMGYSACVRALEVTYNEKENTYHPHFHCLFSLSKKLTLNKVIENAFSHSYKSDDISLFSEEEELFQKIWFLLNTGQTVNLQNIDNVKLGYSVKMNEAQESDFKEVFKYALKSDLGKEECMSYDCFKVYQKALKSLRLIQGYGKAYNLHFDEVQLTLDDYDASLENQKRSLRKKEKPQRCYEDVKTVVKNVKAGDVYLMNKSGRAFLMTEESKEVVEALNKKKLKKEVNYEKSI